MEWLKRNKNIMVQILSVVLLFFFSVVLINWIDPNTFRNQFGDMVSKNSDWGWLVFILVAAFLYAFFIPSTLLGATSGVLFGFVEGSIIYVTACFLSSLVVFVLVRNLLRNRIQEKIKSNEHLSEIQSVIENKGLRLLFLIRYVPVHVTFINLLLGISRIKPRRFLTSCFFLLPEWILHVYIGYVAYSTSQVILKEGIAVEDIFRIGSLILSIGVIMYLSWIAQKVVKQSRQKSMEKLAIDNITNIRQIKKVVL